MDKCYRCNEVISMCPCDESTYTADDEISRLRAELEASETELRIVRASQAESNAEVERLRAELAECKQDAERFRWLRGTVPESSSRWARWRLERWISGAWHELRGLHLDTCIDAALAAEGEK